MDYEELRRKARRGDEDAAKVLATEARKRGDDRTLLVAWSVLHRPRFTAWKALTAALKAAGLESGGVRPPTGADGINSTARIRDDVVARALVDASEKTSTGDDPVAIELIALANTLLENRSWDPDDDIRSAFDAGLKQVLFAEDNAEALSAVEKLVTLTPQDS